MNLDPDVVDILAIVGAAAGVLALLVAIAAHLRIRRMRRDFSVLQGGETGTESFVAAVARKVEEVGALRAVVEGLDRRVDELRVDVGAAIRHVAVVRYDAFADMGGRLSFSAALIDDAGDGLVLTSIHARSETRSYAKGLRAGASDQQLSSEEKQAVGHALRGASGARAPSHGEGVR